jgi:hypothetical protein
MIGGSTRFWRSNNAAGGRIKNRSYAEKTIALAERAMVIIRERGKVKKYELDRLLGLREGGTNNALIYIGENCPSVAEENDGSLIWAREEYERKD